MFNKLDNFYPNNFFSTLNFDDIKYNLSISKEFENSIYIKDFGNTYMIKTDNYIVAINSSGSVQIHYNHLSQPEMYKIISSIENSFKKQVKTFKISKLLQ